MAKLSVMGDVSPTLYWDVKALCGPKLGHPCNTPYFLEMPELLSYLVEHISVLPAMLTPTTTESPSMCCLILYTDTPALVPPICAVMMAGSLKTLGIGRLFQLIKPDQVVQVLGELPHCTHLSELTLELFLASEVRHVTFV